MCGYVLFRIDKDFSQVDDVGVIILKRDFSNLSYQYLSLKIDKEKNQILQTMERDINDIVKFDI